MRLTNQNAPFVWESEQLLALEKMKTAYRTTPVLRHFDHEREVYV